MSDKQDSIPVIKHYEGFGELVTGSNDALKVLATAICMFDNPLVNQYLLDNQLKLQDRITKTQIFPREGMSLPQAQTYRSSDEKESK